VIQVGKHNNKVRSPTFTKQHYKGIANAIKNRTSENEIIDSLIVLFEKDNPRFKKDVFLKACGIEPSEPKGLEDFVSTKER